MPIDQNTSRLYDRVAYDAGYEGMAASTEEGLRLAGVMGHKNVLMMGNHGVLVAGNTVADAFDTLYYVERACKTLVLAYSTGQPLKILDPEAAVATARGWEDFSDASHAHFNEMKLMLDRVEPSYKE